MSISFACDQCRKRYDVDDSLAGKRVKCKGCGAPLTIPVGEGEVDPYDFAEEDSLPRAREGESVLPRGGGRRQASVGVPPWVWLAGGGGAAILVLLVLAVVFSSPPGRPRAAKDDPAAVESSGEAVTSPSKPEPPTPGFQRDETSAAVAVSAWRVKSDPTPEPVEFPVIPKLAIAVPEYFGSDYILYPTTPSPFVMLGDNANDDHYREVWDLRSATRVGRLKGKVDVFKPKALSPDGAIFVTHTLFEPKNFDIWNIATATRIARIADDGKHIYDIADFAGPGNGKVIFGSSLSKMFEIWDFRSGKKLLKFDTPANFEPDSVAFSPGRRYMALTLRGKDTMQVYDLTIGRPAGEFEFEKEGSTHWDCKGVAFSPDGTALAGLFRVGNTARLLAWDAANGTLVCDFHANGGDGFGKSHANANLPLQWLPDQSGWLVFDANIVERQSGQIVWSLPIPPIKYKEHGPRKILDLGRLVALAEVNGRELLRLTSIPKDKITAALSIAKGGGSAVDASLPPLTPADLSLAKTVDAPSGPVAWTTVAAAAAPAKAPTATGKPVPLKVPAGDVLTVLVSGTDANQALVVSSPGGRLSDQKDKPSTQARQVDRVDLAGGRLLGHFEIPSVSVPIAFSPGATRVLLTHSGSSDRVDVHDTTDGKHIAGWRPYDKESGDDRNVAWAEFLNPKRVLTVNPAGTLVLWSIPDCKAVYVSRQVMQGVPLLSPDRKALAVLRAGVLRMLDPATGAPKGDATPSDHPDDQGLKAAAFDPVGRELAAALDGAIVRWDLETGKVIGESPAPSPKTSSLQYGNSRHVLLDGTTLYDLEGKRVVCSYFGGVHPRGGSSGLHRYVAAEGIIDKGALKTIEVPEKKVARAEAAFADPKTTALLREGSKVSIQIVGTPARDADRWRGELTEALTGRIQAVGAEVADNQRVKVVVRFKELDTGREYRIRDIQTKVERGGQIRHLEWELAVADDKGPPVVIAKAKVGLLSPGFFESIPRGENDWDGYLRQRQWFAGAKEVATHGVPYYVARRPDGGVFLPASTFLGYPRL